MKLAVVMAGYSTWYVNRNNGLLMIQDGSIILWNEVEQYWRLLDENYHPEGGGICTAFIPPEFIKVLGEFIPSKP